MSKEFDLQEHLVNKIDTWCCPHIECVDGFTMSVQASQYHYCSPRNDVGPWTHVEVGFPSERVEALMPFCSEPESPTETVYAQVPVAVVEYVIKAHGGVKET